MPKLEETRLYQPDPVHLFNSTEPFSEGLYCCCHWNITLVLWCNLHQNEFHAGVSQALVLTNAVAQRRLPSSITESEEMPSWLKDYSKWWNAEGVDQMQYEGERNLPVYPSLPWPADDPMHQKVGVQTWKKLTILLEETYYLISSANLNTPILYYIYILYRCKKRTVYQCQCQPNYVLYRSMRFSQSWNEEFCRLTWMIRRWTCYPRDMITLFFGITITGCLAPQKTGNSKLRGIVVYAICTQDNTFISDIGIGIHCYFIPNFQWHHL